jgi:hypothetical protein
VFGRYTFGESYFGQGDAATPGTAATATFTGFTLSIVQRSPSAIGQSAAGGRPTPWKLIEFVPPGPSQRYRTISATAKFKGDRLKLKLRSVTVGGGARARARSKKNRLVVAMRPVDVREHIRFESVKRINLQPTNSPGIDDKEAAAALVIYAKEVGDADLLNFAQCWAAVGRPGPDDRECAEGLRLLAWANGDQFTEQFCRTWIEVCDAYDREDDRSDRPPKELHETL